LKSLRKSALETLGIAELVLEVDGAAGAAAADD